MVTKTAGCGSLLRGVEEAEASNFKTEKLKVVWEFRCGDFPALLQSVVTNPKWQIRQVRTPYFLMLFRRPKIRRCGPLPVFENLSRALEPGSSMRAHDLFPQHDRSARRCCWQGFFVGTGHATGTKEETTVAANAPGLISEPLGLRWLGTRCMRSDSAEPLYENVYRRVRKFPRWRPLEAVAGTPAIFSRVIKQFNSK